MRCKKINSLMEGYLRGNLEPNTLREFEVHISSCTQCRNNLEVTRMLEKMANEEVSKYNDNTFFANRVISKLEAQRINTPSDFRIRLITYATVAAAVIIGILIGNKLGNIGTQVITSSSDSELLAEDYFTYTSETLYSYNFEDSENSNNK